MERFAISLMAFYVLLSPLCTYAEVISHDPVLTSAIVKSDMLQKDLHEKRHKDREETITAQGFITGALAEIHNVENTILEYMSQASSVLTNCQQIVNIGEYVLQIPQELAGVISDAGKHPKGAAISALYKKKYIEIYTEVIETGELIEKLVTSKYSFGEGKKTDEKHVNLLSSAERYYILNSVESKLKRILFDLQIIRYYIKTLSWRDLWLAIDPMSYYNAVMIKMDVNEIKQKWNKLAKTSY